MAVAMMKVSQCDLAEFFMFLVSISVVYHLPLIAFTSSRSLLRPIFPSAMRKDTNN